MIDVIRMALFFTVRWTDVLRHVAWRARLARSGHWLPPQAATAQSVSAALRLSAATAISGGTLLLLGQLELRRRTERYAKSKRTHREADSAAVLPRGSMAGA